MIKQLPIISEIRSASTSATPAPSLLSRGLSAIQHKETGLSLTDLDVQYRQARDIYNRITDYGSETRFNSDLLPKQSELIKDQRLQKLQPFFNLFKQLADVFIIFQQLADQGYGKAYFPLANMYRGGQGIIKNIVKEQYYSCLAHDWFQDHYFQYDLTDLEITSDFGWMYKYGRGVEQDEGVAAILYKEAAEQGYARGQYHLSVMYRNGDGVEQDEEVALLWCHKAAEHGDVRAQFTLGWMYSDGHHVEQDYEQAVSWYLKAAEQGYAVAQCELGGIYMLGLDVELGEMHQFAFDGEQEYEAVLWYRKAAEQGYADAQNTLG